MKYAELLERTSFTQLELLAFAHGKLIDDPPDDFGRLPAPPLLMFDRVTELTRAGHRGRIVAEQDTRPDAWFFQCHYLADPVQPGCLGIDAVWQLVGFYMVACGSPGSGRALGCREVEFFGQIRPHNRVVRHEVEIKRYTRLSNSGASLALGDARTLVDGEHIYTMAGAKVGCFRGIAYRDYPNKGRNAVGGILRREGGGGDGP